MNRVRGRAARWRWLLAYIICSISCIAHARELTIVCPTFAAAALVAPLSEGVAGVQVQVLLPAGTGCPDDVQLAPGDLQRLEHADLLVLVGAGFESFLERALQQRPALRRIDMASGVPLLTWRDAGAYEAAATATPCTCAHGHHHTHRENPHWFASPQRVAGMINTLCDGLVVAAPEHAAVWRERAASFSRQLHDLDRDLRAMISALPPVNRRVVATHGILDYFAADYGLEVVAVLGDLAREAPSATRLLALVATMRRTDARAILIEPHYPEAAARVLAVETQRPLVRFDPVVSGEGTPDGKTYLQAMRRNLETLRTALRQTP